MDTIHRIKTVENTPEIVTERLILRRFTVEDAEALYLLLKDREVNTFLPFFSLETKEDAVKHLEENYLKRYELMSGYHYAICLKSDNVPIGCVNVSDDDSHDFGYCLSREFWHQGIVTEAAKAIVERLREDGVSYITATHDIHNLRSGNVMRKLGMTYRYSYEEQWQPKDILVTFRMYQLNFNGQEEWVYKKYWDMYPVHFVEDGV